MRLAGKIAASQSRRMPPPSSAAVASEPAEAQPDMVGFIDIIGPGTITGWAAYTPDFSRKVTVRLYLDDALVAEGAAADQRNDVRDAGFGDGCHGYTLPVPKKSLMSSSVLKVTGSAGEGEALLTTRVLRQDEDRAGPVLFMDASDLVEFLTHHRELSGIQRVQAGYLLGLGNATIGEAACRICARFKSSMFYYEIPYDRFAHVLRCAGDLGAVPASGWKGFIREFKTQMTKRAELKRNDTLFTMGAPWALDDHNETIRVGKFFDGIRYLQIFYDLIPISMPEVVAAPLIPHFSRAMAAMSIYADHVFSISHYSMGDLDASLRKLGRPVPSMSVVPMGGTITDAEGADVAAGGTAQALGIEGPFVLCVGTLEPRKNHVLLYQVWRQLVARHGAGAVPKLVLVGRVGWYMEDFLRMLKVSNYVEETIVHLTAVSNAQLSDLYDTCLFTAFPSVSEGWGLPITESLARHKACVCSNATSMPEAGGDFAIYLDPFSITEAVALFDRLIYDGTTLHEREALLRASFRAPSWAEASQDLKQQLAAVLATPVDARTTSATRLQLARVYKFYNIEASAPDATAMQVFGNFLDQEDALDLLVGWAWFELDVNCTWACGNDAAVRLPLPEGAPAALVAYLEIVAPPRLETAPCTILVDGRRVGALKAIGKAATMIALDLPETPAAAAPGRERTITFRFAATDAPLAADHRLLGLGIRTIAVFAKDDYAGRVRMFEEGRVERVG